MSLNTLYSPASGIAIGAGLHQDYYRKITSWQLDGGFYGRSQKWMLLGSYGKGTFATDTELIISGGNGYFYYYGNYSKAALSFTSHASSLINLAFRLTYYSGKENLPGEGHEYPDIYNRNFELVAFQPYMSFKVAKSLGLYLGFGGSIPFGPITKGVEGPRFTPTFFSLFMNYDFRIRTNKNTGLK
jgi:hypothetical protein